MTESKKLNLSAMIEKADLPEKNKGSSEEKIEQTSGNKIISQTNIQEEKIHEKNSVGIKINLSSIKSDKSEEKKIDIPIEVKSEEIKDEKELYYDSLTSKVVTNSKSEEKKVIKSECQEKDENCSQELFCELSKKQEYIDKGKNSMLFSNYESDFKKEESRVLETIQKLKKLADIKKMTKTNKVFVFGIITATIIGVSLLFYVDPETHSLENYKASILTIAGKEMTKQEVIDHQTDIQNEINWQLKENKLGGYNVSFEIMVNDMGEAVYKFDGQDYFNKEDLDEAITKKLVYLKREKLKQYLRNK